MSDHKYQPAKQCIYNVQPAKEQKKVWDFVERFYPNYYHCDDIAYNDDLHKIVNGSSEEGDDAHTLLTEEFEGDLKSVHLAMLESDKKIYERAIQGFISVFPDCLQSDVLKRGIHIAMTTLDQFPDSPADKKLAHNLETIFKNL